MSFGGPEEIAAIASRVWAAWDLGIPMVAGAGNENRSSPTYLPANTEACLMVTSVDSMDVKSDFANFSHLVHVAATGSALRSAYPGGWGIGSGNSFATALVTGEVALILSLEPDPYLESFWVTAASCCLGHWPSSATIRRCLSAWGSRKSSAFAVAMRVDR